MQIQPEFIEGDSHIDIRGRIDFINDFDMSKIKRVYFITHNSTNIIRAWQGHKIEKRWFFCIKGGFNVKLIKIKNWENPKQNPEILDFELKENTPGVLFIPNGYVNGFKAIENDSKLMVMSDYAFKELDNDEVRYENIKWNVWS